jgi:hypothetical protein
VRLPGNRTKRIYAAIKILRLSVLGDIVCKGEIIIKPILYTCGNKEVKE